MMKCFSSPNQNEFQKVKPSLLNMFFWLFHHLLGFYL